ncbi:MAG: CTP synthetase [Halodesulfurarchaeum sp.]|nr:CTP synthetase [Halodesulfurarchaeum sp.]
MTRALIVGPDRGLDAVLTANDVETTQVPTPVTETDLDEAGLAEAALLFVTDPGEATAIPVAKRLQPGLRIVWYAPDSVPEFVTRQLDLGVDPSLIEPEILIEEQLLALGA